jgi:hypothetical protein
MPHFDQKGGYAGPVAESHQPGWAFQTEQDRQEADRDAEERRKYLVAESKRELAKFQVRPAPKPAGPFRPKSANVETPDPAKLSALRVEITGRGSLVVDRVELISRGKELFAELLQRNRDCRGYGISLTADLTSWQQARECLVQLGAVNSPVPPPDAGDQWRGIKPHPASKIRSFGELWKSGDPLARKVSEFYQLFSKLVFGESLLRNGTDARLRSLFLASGLDPEIR